MSRQFCSGPFDSTGVTNVDYCNGTTVIVFATHTDSTFAVNRTPGQYPGPSLRLLRLELGLELRTS